MDTLRTRRPPRPCSPPPLPGTRLPSRRPASEAWGVTGNFAEPSRRLAVETDASEAESFSTCPAQLSDPGEPRTPDVAGSPRAAAAWVRLFGVPPHPGFAIFPALAFRLSTLSFQGRE